MKFQFIINLCYIKWVVGRPRVAGRVEFVDALFVFLQAAIESMSVGRFFILPFFGLVSVAPHRQCVVIATLSLHRALPIRCVGQGLIKAILITNCQLVLLYSRDR